MGKLLLKPLILIILTLCSIFSYSQKSGSWAETKYGIRAGANFNSLAGISDFNATMKLGYSAGFVLNFRNSKRISSTQEILFTNKGFSFQQADGTNFVYSIYYIDIPWTVNYHIIDNFTLYGGIQTSILVDANSNVPIPKEFKDTYGVDALSRLDLGAVVGAEYMLPSRIFFGLRFSRGIYSAFSSNDSKYNNYNFLLSAGYYFYRKKVNVFD